MGGIFLNFTTDGDWVRSEEDEPVAIEFRVFSGSRLSEVDDILDIVVDCRFNNDPVDHNCMVIKEVFDIKFGRSERNVIFKRRM